MIKLPMKVWICRYDTELQHLVFRHGKDCPAYGKDGLCNNKLSDFQPCDAREAVLVDPKEWVKLAEDQTLPELCMEQYNNVILAGYYQTQQDMLKAGWRKVELEGK